MTPFARSLRSLEHDRPRRGGWIVLGVAVLVAWGLWAWLAEVPLVVESASARLESEARAHAVETPIDGVVSVIHVELGDAVSAGQPLVELDRAPLLAQLRQEQARREALLRRIEHAEQELLAVDELMLHQNEAAAAAQSEALAKVHASRVRTRFSQVQLLRAEALAGAGAISALESEGLRADAAVGAALDRAGAASATHVEREAKVRGSEGRARVAELRGVIAQLRGEIDVIDASLARLGLDVDRTVIRSPVAGIVGELSRVQIGAVVESGERLASVVPPGRLRVTGEFHPADVSGRVVLGAVARVRLDGFPWIRHGTAEGRVTHIASEIRDGTLRVDVDITAMPPSITPHHGAPGTVELEVGRVAPWMLLLERSGATTTAQPAEVGADD